MKRIGLLSDTHGYLDKGVIKHLSECDEVWHAGDIGNIGVTDYLEKWKPLRAVWGNIDGHLHRAHFSRDEVFEIEGVKVVITHIAGYPGRYNPEARELIRAHRPKLFICGHSHILKVQFDKQNQMLHMNPGAAGVHGFHQVKTVLRFVIDGEKITDLEVVELGKRSDFNAIDLGVT
jgi:putative phosphoesterase